MGCYVLYEVYLSTSIVRNLIMYTGSTCRFTNNRKRHTRAHTVVELVFSLEDLLDAIIKLVQQSALKILHY